MPKNYLIELSQYLTQNRQASGQGSGNSNNASSSVASANSNNGHSNHGDINHEDIKGQPWYFGTISRAECDVLLSEKGIDGDFVIRESETNVRISYSLFKIERTSLESVTCDISMPFRNGTLGSVEASFCSQHGVW